MRQVVFSVGESPLPAMALVGYLVIARMILYMRTRYYLSSKFNNSVISA